MSRLHVARAEMRLARRDIEPLRAVTLAPDPLASFQRVLARHDTARGEHAEVVVDLLPATPRERLRFRRRQRQAEITGYVDGVTGSFRGLWDVLVGNPPGTSLPLPVLRNQAAVVFGSADTEQVTHKYAVPAALFYVQVLMRTTSFVPHRARANLDALIACWEPWAGRNRFELAGLNMLGLAFIGSSAPLRRRWFDYRLDAGRFGPARRRLLGSHDIAGWIAPPPPVRVRRADPRAADVRSLRRARRRRDSVT